MTARSSSWIVVLPLLIAAAGPCWSQDTEPNLDCTVRDAASRNVDSNGLTELAGDVIIKCVNDGPAVAAGSPLPTVNIRLNLNTTITSRLFDNHLTEALLFIDEPEPENWHLNASPTATAPNTAGCIPSPQCPNVFQGIFRAPNGLEWSGVPLSLPVQGTNKPFTRIFRLTNIRVNASQLVVVSPRPDASPQQVISTIKIASSQSPGQQLFQASSTVAFVQNSLSFAVRNQVSFTASQGYQGRAFEMRYAELFPTAFKTRNCAVRHPTPRFVDPDVDIFTIDVCRASLLWPFVSNSGGFTSGTELPAGTVDPFCATPPSVPCILNHYGATDSGMQLNSTLKNLPSEGRFFVSTRNLNAGPGHSAYLMTPGGAPAIDQGNGFTPLEQVCPDYRDTGLCTTSWQIIDNDPNVIETFVFPLDYSRPSGPPQSSTRVITVTPSIGPAPGFQGYILSMAKYQLAHGFAFISDVGAQRLAQGYLSLILPDSLRAEAETRVGAFEVRGESVQQLQPADTAVAVQPDGIEKGANTLRFDLTSEGYLPQRLVLGSFGSTRLANFTVTVDAAGKGAVGDSWLKVETIGDQTPVTLVISVDPEGLAPGEYAGSITATPSSQAATPVVLPVELVVPPHGPRVRTVGVTSAGSYAHSVVAPGEAVVIFGLGFGPPALVGLELANGVASTNIGQTRVLFDGEAAPIIYSVTNQVSCFVPFSVAGKKFVEVVVEYQGVASPPARVAVLPSKPALLTADASGSGIGAILTQDFTPNSQKPAKPGEYVVLFGVGGGQTSPPSVGGRLQVGIGEFNVPVRAFLDGEEVIPLYAGPAPDLVEGVFQINLPLSMNVRRNAELPVVIQFGDDVRTQPGVTVWVE